MVEMMVVMAEVQLEEVQLAEVLVDQEHLTLRQTERQLEREWMEIFHSQTAVQ
jgi:hypothetical protein